MKPLLVSSGEPAGIGPDLCVALAEYNLPIVVLGDLDVLRARAGELKKEVDFLEYTVGQVINPKVGQLSVLSIPCKETVQTGQLNVKNAAYVIELLTQAAILCKHGNFAGLVTAPVHKGIINEAGISFTGHTEFLEQFYQATKVVMMLACQEMRVALVTTHLPLRDVPDYITQELIIDVILQLNQSLKDDFGISKPIIKVAGLNPHAGESGYLGREEIDTIIPALTHLKNKGIQVQGPMPADTLFIPVHLKDCDAFVAMYHDQGLPVIKYAGFNEAVNITLGLPIIRTSVDHGTALELAGTGNADINSMLAAIKVAQTMAINRAK